MEKNNFKRTRLKNCSPPLEYANLMDYKTFCRIQIHRRLASLGYFTTIQLKGGGCLTIKTSDLPEYAHLVRNLNIDEAEPNEITNDSHTLENQKVADDTASAAEIPETIVGDVSHYDSMDPQPLFTLSADTEDSADTSVCCSCVKRRCECGVIQQQVDSSAEMPQCLVDDTVSLVENQTKDVTHSTADSFGTHISEEKLTMIGDFLESNDTMFGRN